MTLDEALAQATISIPEAGSLFFSLARNGAYEAARRGEIPVIEVGGKKRVPVAPLAEKLGLQTKFGRAA